MVDKDSIVKQYLPMIAKMARELKVNLPHNVELDDLIQEGIIALLQAIDKYDPRYGATFKTFVYIRIKGAMIDYLRKLDYLPKNVRQDIKKLDKELIKFYEKNGRLPTFEELANLLETDVKSVEEMYNELSLKQFLNLDQYLFDLDENSYGVFEVKSDEDVREKAWKSILYEKLFEAINKLSKREQMLLSMRFEHDLSLKEIAEVFGVTESRISQLLTAVIGKLRKIIRGDEDD